MFTSTEILTFTGEPRLVPKCHTIGSRYIEPFEPMTPLNSIKNNSQFAHTIN